jgi:hypothetical protein
VKAWLLTLSVTLAAAAGAQPSYRQSDCQQPLNGTGTSFQFPSPVVGGNLLVVALTVQSLTAQVSSVTDNLGNVYQPAFPMVRGEFNYSHQVWYAQAAHGGSDTVEVTVDEYTQIILYLHEYGGFEGSAVLDATSVATGSGGLMDSGMVTLSSEPELLFAYAVSIATVDQPPPGFTQRETCSNDMDADRVVLAGGTYNAAFQGSNGPWSSMLLAFKSEPPDAGDDAGSGDGGGTDAGLADGGASDAGLSDAGSSDAGSGDGGPADGGVDENGLLGFHTCGCSSAGAPLLLGVLLVAVARRRSRG